MMTPEEHALVERLGTWWGDLCAAVADGPTRDADLAEAIHHIHALQRMIMAQAAARTYPDRYRLLGSTIPHPFDPSDPDEDDAPADTCRQCGVLHGDHP